MLGAHWKGGQRGSPQTGRVKTQKLGLERTFIGIDVQGSMQVSGK